MRICPTSFSLPGRISSLFEHILLASHSKEIPNKNQVIAAAEVLGFTKRAVEDDTADSSKVGLYAGVVVTV